MYNLFCSKENIIEPFKLIVILISLMIVLLLTSCSDDSNTDPVIIDKGDFTLNAKYDSIRSYPKGCGVFILYIKTSVDFEGTVNLKIKEKAGFNFKLTKTSLSRNDTISELIIYPNDKVEYNKHQIEVIATHGDKEEIKNLYVNVLHWGNSIGFETAIEKRNQFKDWILSSNQNYICIFSEDNKVYYTYPEILVVEHITFLSKDYEVRVCYHVMVPPDDWSMIWIRKRNFIEPEIAAKRESNGTIKQIPIDNYPIMFGY